LIKQQPVGRTVDLVICFDDLLAKAGVRLANRKPHGS